MGEDTPRGPKWDLVASGLTDFLSQEVDVDMGIGIGYFPIDPPNNCVPGDAGCLCIPFVNICFSLEGGSCDAADYAIPAVQLALPANGAALAGTLANRNLGGGTPTRPALEGALRVADAWANDHPGRRTAVVLATDGDPTSCPNNAVADVANVAATALAGPNQIRTFVVGVGSSLTALNEVAVAGGTREAFLTDVNADLVGELSAALERIRSDLAPPSSITWPRPCWSFPWGPMCNCPTAR
jgi:hypothetical protein